MGKYQENGFLVELLSLQQDGSGAISAPTNWASAPLLSVETKLDREVEEVIPKLLSASGSNRNGAWWFLVGSPGNGKSAAVGRLVRRLEEEHNADFRLEKDSSGRLGPKITTIPEDEIPYLVELYEDGANHSNAWFAQDASVVRDPYAKVTDPARDLVRLVKEANKKGVSLVVCANRGVLEKAYEVSSRDRASRNLPWFRALKLAVAGEGLDALELEPEGNKPVFDKVDLIVTPLDANSLIVEGTFNDLIAEASSTSNWEICSNCDASNLCPFKQNRDWLRSSEGVSRVVSSLRLAELFSGQIVVFREAVALISLIFAGCARDYESQTPCGWVQNNIEKGALFSLLSRRIYMLLFSSFSPFGLEENSEDQQEQMDSIIELADQTSVSKEATVSVEALSNPDLQVSTAVGVHRLLGSAGIFAMLDPVKEGQTRSLEKRWDLAPTMFIEHDQALISPLEKKCFEIWGALELGLENHGVQTIKAYRFLRRWITNVTYRLGFFSEGNLLFEEDLREVDEIISSTETVTAKHHMRLQSISEQLSRMLSISEASIEISPVVDIEGRWVRREMEVEIQSEGTEGGGLSAKVGDSEFEISPVAYAWLSRKTRTGLAKETFPDDILQVAEDIRREAATNSGYAFAQREISLKIRLPKSDKKWLMKRFQDHVVVEELGD